MKKLFKKLSLKKVLYAVLTFILALCLIFGSLITILRITFFNGSFLSDTLNSSQYYNDLCVEIAENLSDLGDASGLDKSFFEGFVSEVLVRDDVQSYITDFYEGNPLKVNTSNFDESLQNALKKYIKTNHIKNVNDESLEYFSAKASRIYSNSIKIKYFSAVQDIIVNNTGLLTSLIVVLALISAAICVILIVTNAWKHKALRYIYTALSSAGLFLLILPICVFASGVIGHIAIMSRSLSDMYISILSTVLSDMIVISIVLIVVAVAVWVIHTRVRKKSAV